MSQFSTMSINSASVALRLMTEATMRSAGEASAVPLNPVDRIKAIVGAGQPAPSALNGSFASTNGKKVVLSMDTAEKLYGSDSFLMQTARGRADMVHITTSEVPADKEAFRSEVLNFLAETLKKDSDFMTALKSGKVTVNTVDEVPEMNIQPMVSFVMYQDGHTTGSGGFSPKGTNQSLYDELSLTRGQSIGSVGNSHFYAYWAKSS